MAQVKAPNKNQLKAPTKRRGPLGRRPALRHRHRRLGRRAAHGPQDRPGRRPGRGRRRHQGAGAARPQDHQLRPRRPGSRRAPTSPSAWSPCSSIPPSRWPSNCIAAPTAPTASSSRPTPPRTTTSASPACPSTTTAAGPGARSVVAGSVSAGEGQRQLGPGDQPRLDRRQQRHPQGTDRGAGRLHRPPPRSRSGRAAPSTARRGSSPPASARARTSSRSGGSRRPTSRKAGSTSTAAASAARRWPSRSGGARISSPFGIRRYYGRSSGGGFHNGIDFEGKTGKPIYAAADGVINHQGWYFNYGRTVKISHADNFETLYAHMSRFADGMGPGSRVRKGDLIGYVGSTGRSTGPHLHFSVIVNGQFVDPAPYISEKGGNSVAGRREPGRLPPVAAGDPQGRRRQGRQQQPLPRPAGRRAVEPQPVLLAQRGSPVIWRPADRPRLSDACRCARRFDRLGIAPSSSAAALRRPTGRQRQPRGKDEMLKKYMAAGVVAATLVGAAGTAYAGKDLDAIKARGIADLRRQHRRRGLRRRRQPGQVDRPRRRRLPRRRRRDLRRCRQGQVRADHGAAALHRAAVGRGRPAGRAPRPGR